MTETPQLTRMEPIINIAICTHRHVNPFFMNSIFFMLSHMKDTKMKFIINSHTGVSNLCSGRQARVNEAIKSEATHMLLIDDDMVFAENLVHKMLHECNTLVESGIHNVALGVNPVRKSPFGLYYTASEYDNPETMDDFLKSKGLDGVKEIKRCGLGAFLIETRILREIPAPHFEIIWNDQKKDHEGEDFYFIKKLRKHGVRVFVDQDISQSMGHCGEFIYSYSSYPDVPKVPVNASSS